MLLDDFSTGIQSISKSDKASESIELSYGNKSVVAWVTTLIVAFSLIAFGLNYIHQGLMTIFLMLSVAAGCLFMITYISAMPTEEKKSDSY